MRPECSDAPITVLIIDGYEADRRLAAEQLTHSSSRYRLLEAPTGKTGLAMYRAQRVDCVLTELTLPDMSGFQVLYSLIPPSRRPDIAVIMLTRLTDCPFREVVLSSGVQAYFLKSSIDGNTLHKAIIDALAALASNRPQPL